MRTPRLAVLVALAAAAFANAQNESKVQGRVEAAGTILQQLQSAPDNRIPEEVLSAAECVAVVPSMLNGGFAVGLRYGRGVATCRTPKGWSAPAFFTMSGGSFGLQFGGQAVDVILLIMNKDGMQNLLSSKFKLGADASAAAGPVGRQAAAYTDWKLRAQVLSYSRSRGVFAGLAIGSGTLKQDKDSTRAFYGRMVPFKTSLSGAIDAPPNTYAFLSPLSKWAQAAADR